LLGRMECAMCRWRHDIGTGDDVTYCSDLRGILCGRKNTSVPRLGALGKLKLDHLHIRPCGLLSESLRIKHPHFIAASEVPRTELPNKIASIYMIRTNSTFTRIMGKILQGSPLVERSDRGFT